MDLAAGADVGVAGGVGEFIAVGVTDGIDVGRLTVGEAVGAGPKPLVQAQVVNVKNPIAARDETMPCLRFTRLFFIAKRPY